MKKSIGARLLFSQLRFLLSELMINWANQMLWLLHGAGYAVLTRRVFVLL
jgi:hypothetical protein